MTRRVFPRCGLALLLAFASLCATARDDAGIAAAADQAMRIAQGHRLVILGDLHGTREVPMLVGDIVERASRTQPVLLALEMPRSEQPSLDAALDARDADAVQRGLLARAWWRRSDDQHDGRRSLDMIELLDRLRRLKRAGRDVALLAYDVEPEAMGAAPDLRDAAMADRVREAFDAKPTRRVVMLTGNVHAFLRMPSYMPLKLVTAGMRLADLAPASLRIGAAGGAGWGCFADGCRAVPASPAGDGFEGEYTGGVTLPRLSIGRLVTVPAR